MFRLRRGLRLSAFLGVFNMFNANPEQNVTFASGSNFLRPSNIVPPRIKRFGAKFEWSRRGGRVEPRVPQIPVT